MSSMDKRKGSLVGRPNKHINVHLVLRKWHEGGETAVAKAFTTREKADAFIAQERMASSDWLYSYERWRAE